MEYIETVLFFALEGCTRCGFGLIKERLGLGFRLGFGVFPVLFVIKGGFRDKSGFRFLLTGSSLSFSSGDLPLDEIELESPSSDSSPVL